MCVTYVEIEMERDIAIRFKIFRDKLIEWSVLCL